MAAQQEIEFKATDGLMLRGLYLPSAEAKAAAIILTPGVSSITFSTYQWPGLSLAFPGEQRMRAE